jgi:hypothetical protein
MITASEFEQLRAKAERASAELLATAQVVRDYDASLSAATRAWLLGYAEACSDNAAGILERIR